MEFNLNQNEVFTTDEAAQFLKFPPGALRDPDWRRRVGLQAVRVGKSLRFLKQDLIRFLEERREILR